MRPRGTPMDYRMIKYKQTGGKPEMVTCCRFPLVAPGTPTVSRSRPSWASDQERRQRGWNGGNQEQLRAGPMARDELCGDHRAGNRTRAPYAEAPADACCSQACRIDRGGEGVDARLPPNDRYAGEENHRTDDGDRQFRSAYGRNHYSAQQKRRCQHAIKSEPVNEGTQDEGPHHTAGLQSGSNQHAERTAVAHATCQQGKPIREKEQVQQIGETDSPEQQGPRASALAEQVEYRAAPGCDLGPDEFGGGIHGDFGREALQPVLDTVPMAAPHEQQLQRLGQLS